jgi:hypothetical protein
MEKLEYSKVSYIKAIETEYKGYRFRSRLEARWAVFFDSMGFEWLYESEGFEKPSGVNDENTIRYLPDFYLPKFETWCEVKGTNESLKEASNDLDWILDFGSPIPGINDSYVYNYPHQRNHEGKTHGLLILGNIPEPTKGIILHPIVQHYEGLQWSWFLFEPNVIKVLYDDSRESNYFLKYFTDKLIPNEWQIDSKKIDLPFHFTMVYNSYKAARSARFEYEERDIRRR